MCEPIHMQRDIFERGRPSIFDRGTTLSGAPHSRRSGLIPVALGEVRQAMLQTGFG